MWAANVILTFDVIQRLLKIVSNNYSIPGDYFMSMENFKTIWSYVHKMHTVAISGLHLCQKAVMQFIYQMFPHLHHFHLSIVYFHLIFIL